jgi:hypothetical protein
MQRRFVPATKTDEFVLVRNIRLKVKSTRRAFGHALVDTANIEGAYGATDNLGAF